MYLVVKTNFHKGLHVKMKHATVSADISPVFHCLICGTALKEGMKGLMGIQIFTPHRKSGDEIHLPSFFLPGASRSLM